VRRLVPGRPQGRLGNTRLTPAVGGIILLCLGVWLLEERHLLPVIYRFGLSPYEVHRHQYYRLITSAFLHLSWEHIILNMATLAIVGPAVEAELGSLRFVVLYLLCALGGSVSTYLLGPLNELSIGASGAIFGVMGSYWVLARHRRWDVTAIAVLVVANLVLSFAVAGIDWRDHLGGLMVGAGVTAGLVKGPSRYRRANRAGGVGYEALLYLATLGVLAVLVNLPPGHVNL